MFLSARDQLLGKNSNTIKLGLGSGGHCLWFYLPPFTEVPSPGIVTLRTSQTWQPETAAQDPSSSEHQRLRRAADAGRLAWSNKQQKGVDFIGSYVLYVKERKQRWCPRCEEPQNYHHFVSLSASSVVSTGHQVVSRHIQEEGNSWNRLSSSSPPPVRHHTKLSY